MGHEQHPHPVWLRLFGSCAAPVFVAISAMMVARGGSGERHSLGYYAKRGAIVLAVVAEDEVGELLEQRGGEAFERGRAPLPA